MSVALGAAIAVFTDIGAGLGISFATAKAVDAIARQPEAADKIQSSLLIGCALAEATAVYGLVIGIMLILFSEKSFGFSMLGKGAYRHVRAGLGHRLDHSQPVNPVPAVKAFPL